MTNTRKHNPGYVLALSFLFFLLWAASSAAQNLWETHPLDIKSYSANISVHLDAISEADRQRSWDSEASRYAKLSELLDVISAMDDFSSAETIGLFLKSHKEIFSESDDQFFSNASDVLWQSYFLGGGYDPQLVMKQQIPYFRELHPRFWFPSGSMRLKHFGRVLDAFIDVGDYQTAEVLLNAVYADMIQEQNLSLNDVFALHVRAFQIMVAQRKTTELRQLFEEIAKLDGRGLSYSHADTFYMASRLTYSLTALGEFNYATSLGKFYDEFRDVEGDTAIPKRAFLYFSMSESFIRAMQGEVPLEDAFRWAYNGHDRLALRNLFETLASLNSNQNAREENAKKINERLIKDLLGIYDPLVTKFAWAVLLEHYAANGKKSEYQTALQNLAKLVKKDMRTDNFLGVGKNFTFLDRTIADHALLSSKVLYPNDIPNETANLLMQICLDWHTEIDIKARIKASNSSSIIDVRAELLNHRKVNQEFSANLIWLAKQITETTVERFDKQDFILLDPKNTSAGFAFASELYDHLKLHDFLVSQSHFEETNISKEFPTLNSLSDRLNKNEKLLILSRGNRYLLQCYVGAKVQKCKAKRLSEDFDDLVAVFRKELLDGDKSKTFVSNVSSKIYEQTIGDIAFEDTRNLYLYIGSNLVPIPFNALKKVDAPKEDFFGKTYPLTLVPSLFAKTNKRNEVALEIDYLGIGNPEFATKTQMTDVRNVFTVRSASFAGNLSSLSPLPETEEEILTSAQNFPISKILLGSNATEKQVRTSGIENAKIIHFATHGLISGELENTRLTSPSIALAFNNQPKTELEDGLLTSLEIEELQLNAEVVILSACRTMSDEGKYNSGFGGLTGAFLNAGAGSIVATQWKVESESANIFISSFLKHIAEEQDAAQALRATAISLKKRNTKYSHPYYWAPFVNVGFVGQNKSRDTANPIITELHASRFPGGNSEHLASFEHDQKRFFYGYEVEFGRIKAKSFVSWYEKGQEVKTYFSGGNIDLVSIEREGAIFVSSHSGNDGYEGVQFEYFDFKSLDTRVLKSADRIDEPLTLANSFFETRDGHVSLGAKFKSEGDEVTSEHYLVFYDKNLETRKSFKVEDAVNPQLVVSNGVPILVDRGTIRSDKGRWNFILNLRVETIRNTFRVKTFDTQKWKFSDWREFDGFLILKGTFDGQPKIFVHDRWTYWVSEFDHTEMTLKKKFRWPHRVIRVKSHELNGKRYWLVGSNNRASLAKRLSFADVDFLTSMQNITDGSFIDDGLISEDFYSVDTVFTLSDGGKLIANFSSRLVGFINIFDPLGDGFLLGGVRNRDESFISYLEPIERDERMH